MPLNNPSGLYAFGALIVLIILYLRRPKPAEKAIPSLMFIMKEKGEQKKYRLFKKIVSNLLFLLQLLAIAALAFAVAEPFINISYDVTAKNTVIIVDSSASMQTKSGLSTRFSKAVSQAKDELSGKVSIISSNIVPNILLMEGSKSEAKSILNGLKATDMPTNLEAAMFEAQNILKGEKGKIVVLSDFIVDESTDQLLKSKTLLESKGHSVKLIDFSNEADNVGIIDLEVDKSNVKVFVKNFQDKKVSFDINLIQGSKVVESKKLEIESESLEIVTMQTLQGESRIELDLNDDLDADNVVYISAPLRKKLEVVLITNLKDGIALKRSEQPRYLEYDFLTLALTSLPDINLNIVRPPRMVLTTANKNVIELKPSLIVLHKVNINELIIHGFADYAKLIDQGSSFIITAQDDLAQIDLEGMLPIDPQGLGEDTSVCIDFINFFTKRFEENRCFTESDKYLRANAKNGTLVVAKARDNSPMLTLSERGKGKILYYGIFDDYSNFKTEENYPIFWDNVIDFLAEAEDIRNFNKKFGERVLDVEKAGIHDIDDKRVAVNLLNELESDIAKESEEFVAGDIESQTGRSNFPFDLAIPLAALALLIVLLEIIIVKFRGDI